MIDSFAPFRVRVDGIRWRIFQLHEDGRERPVHPRAGVYWSRTGAERMAQVLQLAYLDGISHGERNLSRQFPELTDPRDP